MSAAQMTPRDADRRARFERVGKLTRKQGDVLASLIINGDMGVREIAADITAAQIRPRWVGIDRQGLTLTLLGLERRGLVARHRRPWTGPGEPPFDWHITSAGGRALNQHYDALDATT